VHRARASGSTGEIETILRGDSFREVRITEADGTILSEGRQRKRGSPLSPVATDWRGHYIVWLRIGRERSDLHGHHRFRPPKTVKEKRFLVTIEEVDKGGITSTT
jgi:hypothetical protein